MAEKVLVVDDDLDTLRLVGLMLQRQGYDILAASNGQQAILLAHTEKPDIILLDVMMPDLDGLAVTRRLRAIPETTHIPIIMFTARSQTEDKMAAVQAGADDYLTKPTQPRELFAHVQALLGKAKQSKIVPQARKEKSGKLIGLLAARGGLGVSTLTLNLGITLNKQNQKEIIVAEFRPGLGAISQELGFRKAEGLNHLLQRRVAELDDQCVEAELTFHNSGIRFLLASSQPRDAQYAFAVDHFNLIAERLANLADYTLVDLGVSLTPITERIVQLCDEIIVVVEPTHNTVTQTKALIEDMIKGGLVKGRLQTILMIRSRGEMQLPENRVQELLGYPLAVIFSAAPDLAALASTRSTPMVLLQPDSLTTQQFIKLANLVDARKA